MNAPEIEGLLYTTLLENPFKNQKHNIKNSEDDWTVSDYLSQNFGMKIGVTMKCLSFHQNKSPKILEDDYFILSLDGITLNNKQAPIFHGKTTHFAQNCVTMK